MPEKENKENEKAIQLVELQRDLENLTKQAVAVNGAIQYIQQKIASLSKVKEE